MPWRSVREHNIRHLPVLNGGALVGVLSIRDIHLIETLKRCRSAKVKVEDAATQEVYVVRRTRPPLDEVVDELAAKKYGSATWNRTAKVVGIFNGHRCPQALSELFEHSPRVASIFQRRIVPESPAAQTSVRLLPHSVRIVAVTPVLSGVNVDPSYFEDGSARPAHHHRLRAIAPHRVKRCRRWSEPR